MNKMKSLAAEEIVTERKLSRRSMALMGGAAAGTVAALGVLTTTGCCLSGAGNAGSTTGCSDSDPSDGAGRGTHCSAAGTPGTPGMAVGCSDSDPSDGAGAGTHC